MSLIPADTEDHEFKARLELQSKVLSCFFCLPLPSICTAHIYIERRKDFLDTLWGKRAYRQLQTSLIYKDGLAGEMLQFRHAEILHIRGTVVPSAVELRVSGQRTWCSTGEQSWASEETVDRQPGEIRSVHACGDNVLATQQVLGQPGKHEILPQERSRSQSS